MAGIWRIIGKGADDSPPTISEILHLSNGNIQRINFLTSNELSHHEEPLNPNQCRSLSSKLVRTLENIVGLFFFWDQGSASAASTLSTRAFKNFYLVSERAKELVESCCSEDWCKASAFQIQNEEAFKDILLETSLCYSAIFELIKGKVPYQDLRQTPTFEPPPSAEVMEDRLALLQRYQDFVDRDYSLDSLVQKQHLAKHLLRRLKCVISRSEDFDVTTASLWSCGDEWGEILELLGGNVCKTTWLGVPCAKKVFEDGVEEELILKEASILALVNHPNIVKFISCGHDRDNTRLFIAMEHMEESLYSVIKKRSRARKGAPFPILSAVHIMLQIAYGTCYLHDAGVAHRDFKTSNIVVRQFSAPHLQDYFHVKLVDFGLSKVRLSASRSNTISRPRIGTTVYMPPEAFHHGRANWSKADVYSFGIMCSVILSGNEPFSSSKFERSKVYVGICSGMRPMLPVDTPKDLACLIKECWDADRNERPNFVDICLRLAQIRHRLLKEDVDGCQLKNDLDSYASLYIQERITKVSNARKHDCKQLLGNVIEEDEWFIPDEEFGIQMLLEGPNMTASNRSKSSSGVEVPRQLENVASQNLVDHKRRFSTPSPQTHLMPFPSEMDKEAGEFEKPTNPRLVQLNMTARPRSKSSSSVEVLRQLENAASQNFMDYKRRSSTPSPQTHLTPFPSQTDKEAGEFEESTNFHGIQQGDLVKLKRQLVQLLSCQKGGYMLLYKVPREYSKMFGQSLNLVDYNAQTLSHLIGKMMYPFVIKGDGTTKSVQLVKVNKISMLVYGALSIRRLELECMPI